jgi:hypothetical protein
VLLRNICLSRPVPPQVRDAVFLHGYNEPVLALLHEAEPTWAGNLRQKVRLERVCV